MAKKLIDGMTTKWNPDKYQDEYKTQLMAMIEEKVKHPDKKHLRVTLPWHGRDLKRGTLGSIIQQAGYTTAEFLELL